MIRKCKFPELPCDDSYQSHGTHKHGRFCRLVEWKKKHGVCPYDSSIQSQTINPKPKDIDIKQTRLTE
jgi:hypothetical protein